MTQTTCKPKPTIRKNAQLAVQVTHEPLIAEVTEVNIGMPMTEVHLDGELPDQNDHQQPVPFRVLTVQPEDRPTASIGLSIIPCSSNKLPALQSWKEYQTTIAPIAPWHRHFKKQGTVGVICGKVSGNLECIDIDVKNDPSGRIMIDYAELIPNELLARLITQSTPNNGFHLIYRCPDAIIERNQKLAQHSNNADIIETRGEGGYFCTNSVNNTIMRGTFNLAELDVEIPVISAAERDLLLTTARSLTRYFPTAVVKSHSHISKGNNGTTIVNTLMTGSTTMTGNTSFVYSEPAINKFNQEFDILTLFTKHQWSVVKEDDDKVYLKRDGSSAEHSGYYFKATRTFFCFSTSTEFKPEKPYNHFQILQAMEGKDDYRTTLRLLQSYGFPVENPGKKTVTAESIAEYLESIGVRYDSFIQDLTIDGKIIEEMDYNTIFINLKKHLDQEVARTRFEETIKSRYISTINPIQDFIDANIHRQPSGTFEQWLDCLVLKNKTISKSTVLHFLKKWYVGMIAQALGKEGDYPNELFLCLLSVVQGIGKTSFLRDYTLPTELHCYRKEHSLSLDDDFKVLMSQAFLIIDDEMDGRTYELNQTFKSILSTKELTMRRKYDRRISTIKRRCSFAGSGNNLSVVRESQNRRVIPIEIEKMHFDRLAELDLTDLFMEAYHLYTNGFKYSYQREDMELLREVTEDYQQVSDVEMLLDEYIMHPENDNDCYDITTLDIVATLSANYPNASKRINVQSIGKLMNERGFEAHRQGKKRSTCYQISNSSKIIRFLGSNTITWL